MTDPPLSPDPLSYAQPDARQSPLGVISIVCATIALLTFCFSIANSNPTPGSSLHFTPFIANLLYAGLVFVVLLGLVTGILGVLNRRRQLHLAIAGLIVNGLISLFLLLLIIIAWLLNR
jgi:hypothetical protein